MDQKTAFRTAAVLYADDTKIISTRTIHKKIIESFFLENDNKEIGLNQLIDKIKEKLELNFDENEILDIINKDRRNDFVIRQDGSQNESLLRLDEKRFLLLKEKNSENNIEAFIEQFCTHHYQGKLSAENIKDVFLKFFYELLNKNISAFNKIVRAECKASEITIDSSAFSIDERKVINDFLSWENSGKNKAIFNLVSYAIEYAFISNDVDASNSTLNSLTKKIFYLDNNIVYRAIGLNGDYRRNRTTGFLNKCKQRGQSFAISKYSIQEFNETIKYHVGLLQKVPFGKINPKLFTKYAITPSIYEFYHRWRAERSSYGFDFFIAHIKGLYHDFVRKYSIYEDYKMPFDDTDDDVLKRVEKYSDEIKEFKGDGYEESHRYDAFNTYFIEIKRGYNNRNITDTKFYFISADQRLRDWDFSRNDTQPLALLPSQWMGILLKFFARTDDDYKSFVEFLKLKQDIPLINEEKLQIILAGISEMTEDFQKQEEVLKRMIEVKFDRTIDVKKAVDSREKSAAFAKSVLEKEMEQQKTESKKEITKLTHEANESQQAILIHKKELLKEYERSFGDMKAQKVSVSGEVSRRLNIHKMIFLGGLILWFALNIFLIVRYSWNDVEQFTYLSGIGLLIINFAFFISKGHSLDPSEYFKRKEREITDDVYLKYNFSLDRYSYLEQQIEQLTREIER